MQLSSRGGRYHGYGEFIQRRFISKEEIIAKLQEYLNQLQAEAKGVEEHIAKLKTARELNSAEAAVIHLKHN